MPKNIPATLTEDQIKFWLANSSLTREKLIAWYDSFVKNSNKNQQMDKSQFVKFFAELESKKDGDSFLTLAFKGFNIVVEIELIFILYIFFLNEFHKQHLTRTTRALLIIMSF